MQRETDVLVIGGGPAGLAAGIAASKKGFSVTVADGAKPPIDKACGEGLMPNTVAVLRELGIEIYPRDGRNFRGIRLVEASSVEGNFFAAPGVGVRRTVLHNKMIERARECGVSMLWNTPVAGLSEGGALLGGGSAIRAKWIIGADGIQSRVRRWAGLNSYARTDIRFAQTRHYRVPDWTDRVEIHWARQMQAYVTPLGEDETCVALLSRDPHIRLEEALRKFPGVARRLLHSEPSSAKLGGITATRRLRRVYRGKLALVGDASGSVDAITGEGLCLSFRQAMALADAIEAGNLENYQKAHRQLAKWPKRMNRLLLLLDRYSGLRKRALRTLAKEPEVLNHMLAVHLGNTSLGFLAATTARFGRQFLTA